jgi:hypothetical protein
MGIPMFRFFLLVLFTGLCQAQSTELNEAIKKLDQVEKTLPTLSNPADCAPNDQSDSFEREEPRALDVIAMGGEDSDDSSWQWLKLFGKNDQVWSFGFSFTNEGPNEIAGKPINNDKTVERDWRFISKDNSRRETFLWITDSPGGTNSDLMDSMIVLIPRKVSPSIKSVGNDLHVRLTTGEEVVFDRKTHLIKSGVLSEGKIDTNPNRSQRKFPPISYKGTGLSIRIDHRGEDPRLHAREAVITQNGNTCRVPRQQLWDGINFRFASDEALLNFINSKCRQGFQVP